MSKTPFHSQVLFLRRPERSESYLARSFTGEEAGGRSRR
jgi:hypothetical protein